MKSFYYATGKADIAFVLDTTGSMDDDILNVANNINAFVESLTTNYNIDANFALITYNDIINVENSTKIHKNNNSNWFTNVTAFKNEVTRTAYYDVGDGWDETPLDGLGMAKELDWRLNSAKFVVLLTDEWSSQYNTYGYSNINEIANAFAADNICVSVITEPGLQYYYGVLWETTNGLAGNIFSSFSDLLLGLANKIGDITNADGEWVFLDDFQAVKLSNTLSNASDNDTDGDGLTDAQELGTSINKDMMPYINLLINRYAIPVGSYTGKTTLTVWQYSSNPTKEDTDNDGMKDARATIVNGKVVTPKDPQPRVAHPMAKVWKEQIKQAQSNHISQNYQTNFTDNVDDFLDDIFSKAGLNNNIFVKEINKVATAAIKEVINFALSNRGKLLEHSSGLSDIIKTVKHILSFITSNETAAKIAADVGAFILNFRLDDQGTAYHSKPDTWQKAFGYNDLYDDVFDMATDMRNGRLYFEYGNKRHVIWAWRGDYWNLGAGGEIGIYEYDRRVNGTDHYNVLDFNLPMTLNLYSLSGSATSYFNWSPTEKQWWITGFNYRYQNPDAGKLVLLGSIDLSKYPQMYTQIKNSNNIT